MTNQTELPFCNKTMDRVAMRRLISKLVVCFGVASTTNISDQVKISGFQQATKASVSLGIDDLLAVPSRGWLVQDAERQSYVSEQHYRCGSLHAVEKLRQSIEAWYATSECSKREMNPSFKMIDPLNPVHMMSFSGARGSISQVHQLLGMRGLMSDPRGQVIDLPIRRNLREGLSLTEYIISCYGARKGVVDTAVRTSDAGYLTRRLVEVVQHIAVRRKDCETTKSIALLNIIEEKRESIRTISYQKLVGRVLADNVYRDVRCIATRNQDISDGLASNSVVSTQPIYVRSPLTRKSIFRICQLRYGRSLAQYDLVELGEAVGIIAGQSIGEPGTQLTSRTFHTGGVFTGDIAEYVRIPFNGLINSDGRLVYPTRTRHGHPAWMCRNDLSVVITSCGNIHNFVVPARSLLMIRSGQYVEAQQIIAEVRAKEFPLKERIQKAIYPNLRGEIHWSKFVWHVRDCISNPIRVVREAGHIRILSGVYNESNERCLFHKDQDRVGIKFNSTERRCNSFETIGEGKIDAANREGSQKSIEEFGIDSKCFLSWSKSPISNSILSNIKVERSQKTESVSLSLERQQGNLNESCFVNIDVQLNIILAESDVFAIYDKFEYQTGTSGILKYGTIEVESIDKEIFIFDGEAEDGKVEEMTCGSWYRVVGGGNSFLIPEESYTIYEPPSSILVTNNTIVEEGARITDTISSKTRGLIRIEKTLTNNITVRVLPGYIHNPGRPTNIPRQDINLVETGNMIPDGIEAEDWVYLQSVTLYRRRKTSVPVRPVVKYDVSSDSLVQGVFRVDRPKTQKRTKAQTSLCISHKNGERIEMINHTTTQLIRTFLVAGWPRRLHETPFKKKNYLSLTSVRINNLFSTFLQVNLVASPPARRLGVSQVSRKLVSVDKPFLAQVNLSDDGNDLVLKNQSITVHSVSERGASFLTLSPFDFSRNNILADSTSNNYDKRVGEYFPCSESSIVSSTGSPKNVSFSFKCESFSEKSPNLNSKERLINFERSSFTCCQSKFEEVGLSGTSHATSYLLAPPYLAPSSNPPLFRNYFLDYSTDMYAVDTSEYRHQRRYLIDENKLILKCPINPFFNRFLLKKPIYSPPKFSSRGILSINLGLLISRNRFFCGSSVFLQSGQVVAIHRDYLLVRTGKTLLATRGAAPHKISGDIIGEGDTSITLPYDRSKSGDITQGLPKVEQLLESRSVASIPVRIEDLFRRWNQGITKLIGNLWSHFLSAGTSMEYCQLILINEIREVYESQGVQISDKHLEIIIRQLTSRVVASEDGITNVFFPGELVELSQAERMNRVSKRPIFYEPIILGMTKASLNTNSFLSEASLQETTRVLAKAAPRGRIDRLKGLKENVILGDAVPVGTGSPEIVCQLEVNKRKGFHLEISRNSKNPTWETKYDLCGYHERRTIDPNLFTHIGLSRSLPYVNLEVR
uniref:DNA-directed RNA polymerase subunit beta'' n=2 Tax=Cyrtomium TaxID=84613 RepID=A0A0S2GK11_9MONI|nr:RNA polymerase beta'' subunit [Cyrtomium devexiscapulae]YP_009479768.1 RNA polymerase beta subunit [Cyrtomium fortunei]ALN96579.1 RNA polymerase beta'' subunit [Cyrtomium devexiscapulae]AVW85969.1 RNA polymerase beta subunit [Cyrtomium fortunei]